jgi:hypothetical protein
MKLEEQLAELARAGLELEPGVTVDDLLYSFDRESIEAKPFDLLLFLFGVEVEREPWGRAFCRKVWNFDTECIESSGAYVAIVQRLADVAGATGRLTDVRDHVDIEGGEAWLEYTLDGKHRRCVAEVRDDWADMEVVCCVMEDLAAGGRRFYSKDNGQAMILFFLDEAAARRINELSNGALEPVVG